MTKRFMFSQIQRAVRNALPRVAPPVVRGNVAKTFDALYDTSWRPVQNQTYLTRQQVLKPASKASSITVPSFTEPTFGTKIFRATSLADVDGDATHNRHEYSRRQAFNCNNTLFISQSSRGAWYLYDANTFVRLPGGRTASPAANALGLPSNTWQLTGDCEPMWHPTDPNIITCTDINGGLVFYDFNVSTKVRTIAFDFTSHMAALGWNNVTRISFQGEGRPSDDGRWWALACQDEQFNMIGFIMYDRQTNTIARSWPTTNKPNNISTSPKGKYAIVSWSNASGYTMAQAAAQGINTTDGTRAYDKDTGNFTQLSYYGEHADTAIDAEGNEVYVSVNYNDGNMPDVPDGYLFYRRLDNGVAYPMFSGYGGTDYAWHMCGTATKRPGWVLVGSYTKDWYLPNNTGMIWKDGVIMAAKLTPTPETPKRLAYTYTEVRPDEEDYFSEPHGTVNNDFTRVLFASDMPLTQGGSRSDKSSYMIALPSWALGETGVTPVEEPGGGEPGGGEPGGGEPNGTEPTIGTSILFNQANGTTLEQIDSNWSGDARYAVTNSALQVTGNGYVEHNDPPYLSSVTGTNQAAQATLAGGTTFTANGETLYLYIHRSGAGEGYHVRLNSSSILLYRASAQVSDTTAHGLTFTGPNTVKITSLNGRIRVYLNGSTTAAIDYTDGTPLTGGSPGLAMYVGGDATRMRLTSFGHGVS
jgi:hypothetical protein